MDTSFNKKYLNDIEAASESIIYDTCFSCKHSGNRKGLSKASISIRDDIEQDNSIEKRNKH